MNLHWRSHRVLLWIYFLAMLKQTTKDVNKSVTYSKINNTVAEGKIQAFALSVDNDSPMVVAHVSEGKLLSSVVQSHTAIIGAKVKGSSFDRPYSVASDGTIDLERISNRGTLTILHQSWIFY